MVRWFNLCLHMGILAAAASAGAPASADSGWKGAGPSAVRLSRLPGRGYALLFRAAPGWKLYWRHPGNNGFPPRLAAVSGDGSWKAVAVRWPAPSRWVDAGMHTVGYSRRLVLFLPAIDARARLRVDYGVCREICIPLAAVFDPGRAGPVPAGWRGTVAAQERLLPRPNGTGKLTIGAPRLSYGRGDIVITVPVRRPAQIARAKTDLFLAGAGLPPMAAPERIPGPGENMETFRFRFRAVPRPGLPLRLVLRSDAGAVHRLVPDTDR